MRKSTPPAENPAPSARRAAARATAGRQRSGQVLSYAARLNPEKPGADVLVLVEILLDRAERVVMEEVKHSTLLRL